MTSGQPEHLAAVMPRPATQSAGQWSEQQSSQGLSQQRSVWHDVWSSLRGRPVHLLSVTILLVLVGLAVGGSALPLPDAGEQHLNARLSPPLTRTEDGTLHLAGTDQLGRDTLSRAIAGARVSLGIALATVLVAGPIGSIIGLVAGYRGGLVDQLVMRLVDLQMAFPTLLFAVFLLYLVGASVLNLVILLSILSWISYARMARAQTLALRNAVFVESATALGCSNLRILFRHILPHLVPVLTVVAVFDFGAVMLAEAGLSFLGLGVQPPDVSWGRMIAEGQAFIYSGGWWLFLLPGLAIFMTVLAARISSAWIQDFLEPARGAGR